MDKISTPLDLYRLLPGTNCRQCLLPSCMAFAVAVLKKEKKPQDCPHLDAAAIDLCAAQPEPKSLDDEQRQVIAGLQRTAASLDFTAAAPRLGARLTAAGLTISCLGKDFTLTRGGAIISEQHCNAWVMFPLLHYILHCQGQAPTGDWVAFAEFAGAGNWRRYFGHRCEDALRQLADAHYELVFEIFSLLAAEPAPSNPANADRAIIIRPLPLVPVLINYWRPEEGFDSKLNILFDRKADRNIPAEAAYIMCRGIVEMLRTLIVRHSRDGKIF